MQEEIIARRIRYITGCYITVIVMGALLMLLSIYPLVIGEMYDGIYCLVCGAVFLGIGIGVTVWWSTIPKVFIKFSDGKLHISGGVVCSPSEVDFCTSCAYWTGYGSIVISVAQKQYKFKYASRVDAAANRINQLKAECLAVEEVQKQIAARNAENNVETQEN